MGTTSYSSNANFDRGYRLYSLTGSDTTKVATISTGTSLYGPYNFTLYGSDLYFTQSGYSSGSNKYYLKKYDGSSITTIRTGTDYYNSFTVFDSKLYWLKSSYANSVYTFSLNYFDPSDDSFGSGSSNLTISNGYIYGPVILGS